MSDHARRLACGGPLRTNPSCGIQQGMVGEAGVLEKAGTSEERTHIGAHRLQGKQSNLCYTRQRISVLFYATRYFPLGSSWEKISDSAIAHQGVRGFEFVTQENGIALVAFEFRVARESLHYSRCFDTNTVTR